MKIALAYNIRHSKPSLRDKRAIEEAEFDEASTIRGIRKALESLGHRVFLVEANEGAYAKLKQLKPKIDLVFNIAEGLHGADREAQIPAMLEMLQIPYVGSKPLTQAVCLDKAKTKEILGFHGIATPRFQIFEDWKAKLNPQLRFPLIVKPNSEGSSKGIFQSAFVKNPQELQRELARVFKFTKQAVLAEEFLAGREFTVALLGNAPAKVLPPVEVDFSSLPKEFIPIDSYETKWLVDNPSSQIQTAICPAKLSAALWRKIQAVCLAVKAALGILDWARIDLRLDSRGIPHVLEVNQIPGIIPDEKENSRFPLAARAGGFTYPQMLQAIIAAACRRYNLKF